MATSKCYAPALPRGKEYHVFFSYSHKDQNWVKEVTSRLESEEYGFKCCVHERDFKPGATIIENIDYHLETSAKYVLVLTPDAIASDWCKFEANVVTTMNVDERQQRLIPVLLKQCSLPTSLRSITYIEVDDSNEWWIKLIKSLTTMESPLRPHTDTELAEIKEKANNFLKKFEHRDRTLDIDMDLEKTDVLSAFNEMEEILLEEIRKLREQQMNILQEKYARKKRSLISGRDIADSIISDLTKLDTAVKSEKPNLEKQLCYQAEFLMKKEDEFLFRKQKFSVLNKERLREDLHMLADSFQIEQYTQDELISQVHKDSFNSAIHPDDVRFVAIQTDDSGRVVRSAKLKCPSFTFDDKTCNTVCSISERGELTNSSLPQPPPPSDTRLKNYFGAVGTTYFQTGLVYYQLQVDVDIRKQLEKRDLLFEAGLAHRGYVDIKHAVSCADEGWSFTAARCPKHDMICVEAYHNHHLSYHLQLASNQVGKWDTLRYSFLVDIPHKKWHIFDAVKPAHLYSVDNIDVSQPLIPVFGAYFPTGGDTIVKVITGRDVEISDSMKEKLAKVLNYS